ncbi:MAG TPA: Rid family detoxifying hydrolase [Solirubrobacteraceae bacterium]|nr:Rid family detoxifying hydrolase [Solirubrobacteraceae bacterium]
MDHARHTVQAPGAPAAIGPYSHAVRASGELLFCSGQIPLDPASGELVGVSAGEQARRCLENLRAVCVAAGTTLERAVRVTIYMTNLGQFAEVNEVCAELFPADPPARVTIGVAGLPRGAQVEIDAVVAVESSPVGGMEAERASSAIGPPATVARPKSPPSPPSAPPSPSSSLPQAPPSTAPPSSSSPQAPPPPPPPPPPAGAPPLAAAPWPTPSDPAHVFHVELRHFPRNLCHFNMGAEELQSAILEPWAADRMFDLGDLRWDPRQARLTVLEGPRISPDRLTMGRGWSTAKRQGTDVTAQLLAAAGAPRDQ